MGLGPDLAILLSFHACFGATKVTLMYREGRRTVFPAWCNHESYLCTGTHGLRAGTEALGSAELVLQWPSELTRQMGPGAAAGSSNSRRNKRCWEVLLPAGRRSLAPRRRRAGQTWEQSARAGSCCPGCGARAGCSALPTDATRSFKRPTQKQTQ